MQTGSKAAKRDGQDGTGWVGGWQDGRSTAEGQMDEEAKEGAAAKTGRERVDCGKAGSNGGWRQLTPPACCWAERPPAFGGSGRLPAGHSEPELCMGMADGMEEHGWDGIVQ